MKTARQLGLKQKEFDALVKVRDGLASGEFRHVKNPTRSAPSKKKAFNMDYWYWVRVRHCWLYRWMGRKD